MLARSEYVGYGLVYWLVIGLLVRSGYFGWGQGLVYWLAVGMLVSNWYVGH